MHLCMSFSTLQGIFKELTLPYKNKKNSATMHHNAVNVRTNWMWQFGFSIFLILLNTFEQTIVSFCS